MEADSTQQALSLHPKAYRFFPKHQEEKSSFDKKGVRFYFLGQIEHDQYQVRKLKQFHQYVKTKGKTYNSDIYHNDHLILVHLAANKYKPKQALKAMQEYTNLRLNIIPSIKLQKIQELLKTGFFYISGRDKLFRPIIIFRVKMLNINIIDLMIDAVLYTLDAICNNLLLPGQVETWNIIYDLSGITNLMDLPMNSIKKVIGIISMNYAFKLWRSYVLSAPSSITFFWKVVSAFLDDVTVAKTKISKQYTEKAIFQHIDPSQVQIKYGGTQPDRTQYFPFKIPPAKFDQTRLITDEQYEFLLKSGKLQRNKIDPVFNEGKK